MILRARPRHLALESTVTATATKTAFRGLYDEHHAFVWAVLRKLGVPERDADLSAPGLLLLDPALDAELTLVPMDLPPAFVEAAVEADAYAVRRNGAPLGVTLERRLGPAPEDPRVVLFAAPGALERQGSIYARVVADTSLSLP